jgi:hypothetical protein
MSSLNRYDRDLHYPNGEHRTTAPSANGTVVARYEKRIKAHLDSHRRLAEASR